MNAALPSELLARIFSWIHPHSVARYRLLCHTINAMLLSRSFAVENLARFIARNHIGKVDLMPTTSVGGRRAYKESGLVIDTDKTCYKVQCNCEMRVDWFCMLSNHQEVYYSKYLAHPIVITNLECHWIYLRSRIPVELGSLSTLVSLSLVALGFHGSIPKELGQLINLEQLNLSSNSLSGPIPPELGRLVRLKKLMLYSNKLVGEIPSNFVELKDLKELILKENLLSGSIYHLGGLVGLVRVILSKNRFSGEIPCSFGNMKKLELLDLRDNQLSGRIPDELGGLNNLVRLFLNNNQLDGCVPSSFANLSSLSIFEAHQNNLTGSLPSHVLAAIVAKDGWFTI